MSGKEEKRKERMKRHNNSIYYYLSMKTDHFTTNYNASCNVIVAIWMVALLVSIEIHACTGNQEKLDLDETLRFI